MPRYIIRINKLDKKNEDKKIINLVKELGVIVDDEYGLIPLEADHSSVMLRGFASCGLAEKLNQQPEFDVFPDLQINTNLDNGDEK